MSLDTRAWFAIASATLLGLLLGMTISSWPGAEVRWIRIAALIAGFIVSTIFGGIITWIQRRALDSYAEKRKANSLRREQEKQAKDEDAKLKRLENASVAGTLQMAGVSVPNIRLLLTRTGKDQALEQADVTVTYSDIWRRLPGDIEVVRAARMKLAPEESKRARRIYHNDGSYALDSFTVTRHSQEEGRRWELELELSPTDYATFEALNLRLDDRVLSDGTISIRDSFQLFPKRFDPNQLDRLPVHLRLGTNVVVFSKDRRLVLAARSPQLGIAPGKDRSTYFLGVVGEGMLRPLDADDPEAQVQRPSPFRTAIRALQKELCLTENDAYSRSDLKLIGLFFDFGRYQPILVFSVTLNILAEKVLARWPTADDAAEHDDLVLVDASDCQTIRDLLRDQLRHEGNRGARPARCASNHVRASLLLASLHRFGYRAVEEAFAS